MALDPIFPPPKCPDNKRAKLPDVTENKFERIFNELEDGPDLASLNIGHEPERMEELELLKNWAERTAPQLTYAGLIGLHERVLPGSLAMLFRNHHFSVVYMNPEDS